MSAWKGVIAGAAASAGNAAKGAIINKYLPGANAVHQTALEGHYATIQQGMAQKHEKKMANKSQKHQLEAFDRVTALPGAKNGFEIRTGDRSIKVNGGKGKGGNGGGKSKGAPQAPTGREGGPRQDHFAAGGQFYDGMMARHKELNGGGAPMGAPAARPMGELTKPRLALPNKGPSEVRTPESRMEAMRLGHEGAQANAIGRPELGKPIIMGAGLDRSKPGGIHTGGNTKGKMKGGYLKAPYTEIGAK